MIWKIAWMEDTLKYHICSKIYEPQIFVRLKSAVTYE